MNLEDVDVESDVPEKWPVPSNRTDRQTLKESFAFDDYRPGQREVLERAAALLYDDDSTDTVVIDAPTGVGKSAINTALCDLARGAFYTTPQKALRKQLYDDDDLQPYLHALRARDDYRCDVGSQWEDDGESVTCKECPVNRDSDETCADYTPGCNYWVAKEKAFSERVAALTFAYLTIDDYLPTSVPVATNDDTQTQLNEFQRRQVSFGDRELLVVDEAHELEEQTASLHVGFTLSPRTFSQGPAGDVAGEVDLEDWATPYEMFHWLVIDALEHVPNDRDPEPRDLAGAAATAGRLTDVWEHEIQRRGGGGRLSFDNIYRNVARLAKALDAGDDWVVTVERRERAREQHDAYAVTFKPVRVDEFLAEHVWPRADKVVLSTATLPFRNNPAKWLNRLGLDAKTTELVSVDMPFPVENRPVYLGDAVGELSSGGFDARFDEIVATLTELCKHYDGANGLVHTVSYDRARRLAEALGDRALADTRQTDNAVTLAKWQNETATPILCSPSMMDGVDLAGEKCRWQALAKVPYPNMSDPRVNRLVNDRGEWGWYNEVAARRVIQSVGRAVRSPDDTAGYHVLDECFREAVMPRSPGWFTDAVTADGMTDQT